MLVERVELLPDLVVADVFVVLVDLEGLVVAVLRVLLEDVLRVVVTLVGLPEVAELVVRVVLVVREGPVVAALRVLVLTGRALVFTERVLTVFRLSNVRLLALPG